jgi:hypothetical protein
LQKSSPEQQQRAVLRCNPKNINQPVKGVWMMTRKLGLLVCLLLMAAPVYAQKVTIDYAHDYDFEKVTTFAYIDTKETNPPNDLMGDRIKKALIAALTEGGLKEAETDIDLFVTYHLTKEDNTVLTTTGFGYGGYGAGWGAWGGAGGTSTTTAMNYTEGTLIVDAYEPFEKKMVWRGSGTVTVKSDPEAQTAQIEKIIAKMSKKWAKILANMEPDPEKKKKE